MKFSKNSLIFSLILILFSLVVLRLLAFQPGKEFQVNTYTRDMQLTPVVAMDKRGNFVIAWDSNWQDGSFGGIYARRFNKNGNPIGGEFRVNTITINSQQNPVIAMDKRGNFVIAWNCYKQNGIFAKRFNKYGVPIGDEFQVFKKPEYDMFLSMNKKGNFIIVRKKFANIFDKDGKLISENVELGFSRHDKGWIHDIVMDKKGNFVIVGQGRDKKNDVLCVRRYNKYGKPRGEEFAAKAINKNHLFDPAIAMDENGNFVVVWEGNDINYYHDICARRFNKEGKPIGNEFRVNTYWQESQCYPSAAMNKVGNFIITWQSNGQDGDWWGVFAKMYTK